MKTNYGSRVLAGDLRPGMIIVTTAGHYKVAEVEGGSMPLLRGPHGRILLRKDLNKHGVCRILLTSGRPKIVLPVSMMVDIACEHEDLTVTLHPDNNEVLFQCPACKLHISATPGELANLLLARHSEAGLHPGIVCHNGAMDQFVGRDSEGDGQS